MNPDPLDIRLAALEARAPAAGNPPEIATARRRRFAVSLSAAPILVLALVASVGAAGVVVANFAKGTPGAENPGQPLAGANLECMAPRAAAAYLTERGYTRVVWQVETGSSDGRTGTSTQLATPPEHGFVVPGSFIDGVLYMVIDQRSDATGVGACAGAPMP